MANTWDDIKTGLDAAAAYAKPHYSVPDRKRVPKVLVDDTEADDAAWHACRFTHITSTESAALINPIQPNYEGENTKWVSCRAIYEKLAHKRKVAFKETQNTLWGKRLEAPIAYGIADDQGFEARPFKPFLEHGSVPIMGSSFDFEAVASWWPEPMLFEIKKISGIEFKRDGWDWETIGGRRVLTRIPAKYYCQVQHQLAVANRSAALFGILVDGSMSYIRLIQRDPRVISEIEQACEQMANAVRLGDPPEFNFALDGELISLIWPEHLPEKRINPAHIGHLDDLCAYQSELAGEISELKKEKDSVDNEIKTIMAEAPEAKTARFKVHYKKSKDTPPTEITADMVGQTYGGRKGSRTLRVIKSEPKPD